MTRVLPRTGFTRQEALDRLSPVIRSLSGATDPASNVPAGYTFFGQFIDHDITLDVSTEPGFQQRRSERQRPGDAGSETLLSMTANLRGRAHARAMALSVADHP